MGCWEVPVCFESVNRKPYMYTVFVGCCGFQRPPPSRKVEPLARSLLRTASEMRKATKEIDLGAALHQALELIR